MTTFPTSSSGSNNSYPFCSQSSDCSTLASPSTCFDGYCDNGLCRRQTTCPSPNICRNGNCVNPSSENNQGQPNTQLCSATNPPPNPPQISPKSIVRGDLSAQTAIPGIYWIKGSTNGPAATLALTVSSSDPGSEYKTSWTNWTIYDKSFNEKNINKGTQRLSWTQRGVNPQTFSLTASIDKNNLPAGVHKLTFLSTRGSCDGVGLSTYIAIDNPEENESPYIREIPQISLRQGDRTIINLDELGFDPDEDKNSLGMIKYSIVSSNIEGIKVCGISPLTNNENHVLTLAPSVSGTQSPKDVSITLRATDGATPAKSFERSFKLTIMPPAGTPTITNPSNLQNCLDVEEPVLDIEGLPSAEILSAPRVFNITKLLEDLNIKEKISALKVPENKSSLFTKWINQSIGKDNFVGSLIAGGHGYLRVRLAPEAMLASDETFLLNFLLKSKADNLMYNTLTKVVSYNEGTKELVLDVKLTDDIPPGNATLIINSNKNDVSRFVSKIDLTILPRVLVSSIKDQIIDRPNIKSAKLIELPNQLSTTKKQYLLVIKGANFMKSAVNINNQLVRSPIGNIPFTTLTFVNSDRIAVKKVRVRQQPLYIDKSTLKVRLIYDISASDNLEDTRFFTISTLAGQETGMVTFTNSIPDNTTENPLNNSSVSPNDDKVLTLDNIATGGTTKPTSPNKNDSQNTTTNQPNSPQAAVFLAPAAPIQTGGRPPEFGGGGRPSDAFIGNNTFSGSVTETNTASPNQPSYQQGYQPSYQQSPDPEQHILFPPPDFSRLAKLPSNPGKPTPTELKRAQALNSKPSNIPEIKLIPSEVLSLRSDTSLTVDTMSLDLSGPDQVISTPSIPLISFAEQGLETATLESLNGKNPAPAKKQTKKTESPIQTIETHGVIKSGFSGYTLKLKDSVMIKPADVKNIIYAVIDSKKKLTVLPSGTIELKGNSLTAKLSFPETINSGVGTLVALLNKGGGKKEVLSKGSIKLFDSFSFENVGEKGIKTGLPKVKQIQAQITGHSKKGGKIIRLLLNGENFASRSIKINGKQFISEPNKSHTYISFTDEKDIQILRTRVLNKGRQILLVIRFTGDDITNRSFTISTPKGQFFSKKTEIKLLSKPPVRNVILDLDNETDKSDKPNIKLENKKG